MCAYAEKLKETTQGLTPTYVSNVKADTVLLSWLSSPWYHHGKL